MFVSRIHRLSPELANQIAAGEVVERPASVVKELAENALDAGATRISVTTEFGVANVLVIVEDDGEGMSPEDAVLAIERHATSKIARASDLAAINTLGFRGEALPSIASVSRFRLRTRARGALSGTEIRVEGGTTRSVREVGAPEGTMIEVADLFFNLPARRKFLKADTAESAQVSRLVTQLALGYPEVGFVLKSGTRVLIEAAPAGSIEERFYQIYGERPDLVPVRKDAAGITIRGFIAALTDEGPVRGPQHVFVNRRIVRDRTITHAIQQAYSVATIKERSPEVHLFIDLPPDRVDVNVHPTKAEVRFLDQGLIHEVLRRAVVDALGQGAAPELILAALVRARGAGFQGDGAAAVGAGGRAGLECAVVRRLRGRDGRRSAPRRPRPFRPCGRISASARRRGARRPPRFSVRSRRSASFETPSSSRSTTRVWRSSISMSRTSGFCSSRSRSGSRPGTIESPSGSGRQVVLELGPGEHATLVGHAAALGRFGFEVEDFGGTTLRVSACSTGAAGVDAQRGRAARGRERP